MAGFQTVRRRAWAAACLSWIACVAAVSAGAAPVREARPLMGTIVEVTAEGRVQQAHAAIDTAYREMQRLSDLMNHYDPKSVVSAINAAAGAKAVRVPPELMAVLAMAQALSARSDGAFDITVAALRGWRFRADAPRMPSAAEIAAQLPRVGWKKLRLEASARTAFLSERGMRIDLGGIAKLPIVHAGMQVLQRHGIARAMVNGGGDVEVIGGSRAHPWRIGVRDPRAPERLLGVLQVERGFVVTSGDYERSFVRDGRRYHHILDPRTGYPADGPHGVTLFGERLEDLNGLGVAIMVRGKAAGMRWLAERPGLEGLIVDADEAVWMTPGFRARFSAVQ